MNVPLTYMERLAALEARVAELERQLREQTPPKPLPAFLLRTIGNAGPIGETNGDA